MSTPPSALHSGQGSHPGSALPPVSQASPPDSQGVAAPQIEDPGPPRSGASRFVAKVKKLKNSIKQSAIKQLPSQRRLRTRQEAYLKEGAQMSELLEVLKAADIRSNPDAFLTLLDKAGQQFKLLSQLEQEAEHGGEARQSGVLESASAALTTGKDIAENFLVDVFNTLITTAHEAQPAGYLARLGAAGRLLNVLAGICDHLGWDQNSAAMENAKQAFSMSKRIAGNHMSALLDTLNSPDMTPDKSISRFCEAGEYFIHLVWSYDEMGENRDSQEIEWAKEVLTYSKGRTVSDLSKMLDGFGETGDRPAEFEYITRLGDFGQLLVRLINLCDGIKSIGSRDWERHKDTMLEFKAYLNSRRAEADDHIWTLVADLRRTGIDPVEHLVRVSHLKHQLSRLEQLYEDMGWRVPSVMMNWAHGCLESDEMFSLLVNNVYEVLDFHALFNAAFSGDLGNVLQCLNHMKAQIKDLKEQGTVLNYRYYLRHYLSELPETAAYFNDLNNIYEMLSSELASDALCTQRSLHETLRLCIRDELRMR